MGKLQRKCGLNFVLTSFEFAFVVIYPHYFPFSLIFIPSCSFQLPSGIFHVSLKNFLYHFLYSRYTFNPLFPWIYLETSLFCLHFWVIVMLDTALLVVTSFSPQHSTYLISESFGCHYFYWKFILIVLWNLLHTRFFFLFLL